RRDARDVKPARPRENSRPIDRARFDIRDGRAAPVVQDAAGPRGGAEFEEIQADAILVGPDDLIDGDASFAGVVGDQLAERIPSQPRYPTARATQARQSHGRVQLCAAHLHVETPRLFEPPKVGRAKADHCFAKSDCVWHRAGPRCKPARESSSVRACTPHGRRLACGLRGYEPFRASRTISTYCRASSRMRSKLRSATARGSTSWPPTPRQQAPAFRKAAAVVRSTPPVGINRACGRGARRALKNAGPTTSAGKTFTMSAPASHAARISVGVKAPGMTSLS